MFYVNISNMLARIHEEKAFGKYILCDGIKCMCECNKEWRFGKYLKNCTCIKNGVDKLVMMCNETVNIILYSIDKTD